MRRILIWIGLIVTALVVGLGGSFVASRTVGRWSANASNLPAQAYDNRGWRGQNGPGGMMGQWFNSPVAPNAERITIDTAVEKAEASLSGTGLEVKEVMEFDQNFYAAIVESDTGRGAYEILLDPYSGAAYSEPGPNMMWNVKYGHMGSGMMGYGRTQQTDNTVNLDEARAFAQKWLDANLPGAAAHADGTAFYGYYTFDYDQNGTIAGMLSVNGYDGAVWPHTWHGNFIAEKEMEK